LNYHLDILPNAQRELLKFLQQVPDSFVLYGGTAIALYLGHRKSIDFDFFSNESFDSLNLYRRIPFLYNSQIIQSQSNTLTALVKTFKEPVKVSFFGNLGLKQVNYPGNLDSKVKIASLLDLFGMKCATIPQRVEKKDYVDVYAILTKTIYSLEEGLGAAQTIYGNQFNPIFTLKALAYYDNEELSDLESSIKNELVKRANSTKTISKAKDKGGLGTLPKENE